MSAHHAVVWIDHTEARIFRFVGEGVEHTAVHPKKAAQDHAKHHHHADVHHVDTHYFDDVIRSVQDAERILIVGPSKAKLELLRHLQKHAHGLEAKVVGVETVDHPTDGQLVAYAKQYFHASDRMSG